MCLAQNSVYSARPTSNFWLAVIRSPTRGGEQIGERNDFRSDRGSEIDPHLLEDLPSHSLRDFGCNR